MFDDPVATLDELLDVDPFCPGIDEQMTVVGDLLQARGDRRGELIVLEQALVGAVDRRAQAEHVAAYRSWLYEHQAELFGEPFARYSWIRGALKLETRGGRLRRLTVDLRRLEHTKVDIDELFTSLVAADGARSLVELRVRVGRPEPSRVEAALAQAVRARRGSDQFDGASTNSDDSRVWPPLEHVIVSTSTGPTATTTPGSAPALVELLPRAWLVTSGGKVASLFGAELDDHVSAEFRQLGATRPPMSVALRVAIGRALTSGREQPTLAACELIANLDDSARAFESGLRVLLRPQVWPAARWLIPALPNFGAWVDVLRPQLASMTGGERRHAAELRSLAGHSLSAFAAQDDLNSRPRG